MERIKEITIKNRTYYFYNDIINLDEFDESNIFIIFAMNMKRKFQNVM